MPELLAKIIQNPEDLTLRLAFADAEAEAGNISYAEFIRLQCQLESINLRFHERQQLNQKVEVLLKQNENSWLASLDFPDAVRHQLWRGGFVDDVVINLNRYSGQLDEILQKAPITTLTISDECAPESFARLAADAALLKIRNLDLRETILEEAGAKALFASPFLANIESIQFADEDCLPEIIRHLANSALPALKRLRFEGYISAQVGTRGVELLASSAFASRLVVLELLNVAIDADGAKVVADTPAFARLEQLSFAGGHYSSNQIGAEGASVLSQSPHLGELQSLNLGFNHVGDAGFEAITKSRTLQRLSGLYLQANDISRESFVYFSLSPFLHQLKSLDLSHNQLCDHAVERLVLAAPEALEVLWLYHNPITDRGARMLANAPMSAHLTELNLAQTGLTDEGAQSLLDSVYLTSLDQLFLGLNNFSDAIREKLKLKFGDVLRDIR